MKPLIGITCSRLVGGAWGLYAAGHFMDYTFDEYSRAVLNCGGVPILIPIAQNAASLKTIMQHIDGLILSGGPDVNPRHYGEAPLPGLGEVDEDLDRTELAAAQSAYGSNLPILAVCRGIQVLNVSLGGSLYQDIQIQVDGAINHVQKAAKSVNTHRVTVNNDTRLYQILKSKRIWVNGRHHQAVKRVAASLKVSAVADDGVVEAVEASDRRFVVGVQWHPEGTWQQDRHSRKLFRSFIAAAGIEENKKR